MRKRPQDRLHDPLCHVELCPWDCMCWCHQGPTGSPTLPPEPTPTRPQDFVRVRAAASVTVVLYLNGQPLIEHAISVMDQTIVIEAGPLSVRTTDRLTVEARVSR